MVHKLGEMEASSWLYQINVTHFVLLTYVELNAVDFWAEITFN